VTQLGITFPLALQGIANMTQAQLIVLATLQKAAVSTDSFLPRIAGYALKCLIRIDDWVVRPNKIGDHDGVDARLDSPVAQPQFKIDLTLFGNVLNHGNGALHLPALVAQRYRCVLHRLAYAIEGFDIDNLVQGRLAL